MGGGLNNFFSGPKCLPSEAREVPGRFCIFARTSTAVKVLQGQLFTDFSFDRLFIEARFVGGENTP